MSDMMDEFWDVCAGAIREGERVPLHAVVLCTEHPVTGEPGTYEVPLMYLPEYMTEDRFYVYCQAIAVAGAATRSVVASSAMAVSSPVGSITMTQEQILAHPDCAEHLVSLVEDADGSAVFSRARVIGAVGHGSVDALGERVDLVTRAVQIPRERRVLTPGGVPIGNKLAARILVEFVMRDQARYFGVEDES